MTRFQTAIGFLVVQTLAAAWVQAQTTPAAVPASASAPRYKVAYWFDRAWPVPTFRSQAYDVGKGEYDAQAVGRWLDLMATRHPGYAAYVRDVDAPPGRDALATTIERERRHVAEFGGPSRSAPAAVPGQAGPTPSRPAPEAGTRPAQRQVTNYIPIPDYAKLMHPTISGYDRPRPTGSSTLGSPLGGWRGFNYGYGLSSAPGSTGYPFPVPMPYPRPHP